MNCNRCNRLLIARDAQLQDALDSNIRLELTCECGAVYSAFIADDDWIYAGKNETGLICERQWTRTDAGIVRWLAVDYFAPCLEGGDPRDFTCRIAANDPRPRGRETHISRDTLACLLSQEIGQWHELIYAPVE